MTRSTRFGSEIGPLLGGAGLRTRLIGIALLACAVYGPDLDHAFQFDDEWKIVENRDIRDPLSYLRRLGQGRYHEGASRLVSNLSISLDYALFELDPFGYHLTNLLLHALNVVLLGLLGHALLSREDEVLANSASVRPNPTDHGTTVILAAALFAVHPLNSEAVNYCNARPNLWVTAFYLSAVLAALRARALPAGGRARRWGAWALFAVALCLALLSKELAVTVLVMAPLVLWWFAEAQPIPRARPYLVVLAVAGLLLLGLGIGLLTGSVFEVYDAVVTTGNAVAGSFWMYLIVTVLEQSEVFLRYLALALLPWPGFLNADRGSLGQLYDRLYEEGRVVAGALEIVLAPLLCFGLLLFAVRAIFAWRRRAPFASFCALWPFVTHAPTSLVPRGQAMVEYRTYLPMVGVCLLLAWVLVRLLRSCRLPIGAASAVLVFVLAAGTMVRNQAWATPRSLWEDTLRKAPGNSRAHLSLGNVARKEGDLEAAVSHYRRALQLDPDYGGAHTNLGALLAGRGDLDGAAHHLARGAALEPEGNTYNNLANVLVMLGRMDEALVFYRKALARDPHFPEAELNLGMALVKQGDVDAAMTHYERALVLEPGLSEAHLMLGQAQLSRGQLAQALSSLRRAVELQPDSAKAHAALGVALSTQGAHEPARRHLARALELDSGLERARAYLEELRGRTRR